jgi:hypothetical protein
MSGLANLPGVPSAKRKSGRNPLQRLSDQRRSLALAGLAVGAVFSAAIFRRKRRGGESEFGQPIPPTVPPASQPDFGPPAAAPVPAPAAIEPEPPVAPPVTPQAPAEPEPAPPAEPAPPTDAASSATVDPATGELSAEEASILAVLAQHGRSDDDRTVIAVATSLERESADVANVLRKLSAEGVVAGELYTAVGDKIWSVTDRGVRRLGAQH